MTDPVATAHAEGPACGPREALALFVVGLAVSYAAARLDANPSTLGGSLQPLVMFLGWIAPAYALASARGRDPLVAHAVLVRSRDLRPAALVSVALLVSFAIAYVAWARHAGQTTGASPPNELTRSVVEWLVWGFLFVAFPEEYFFRGVLQPALDSPEGRTLRVLGADLGRGALVSALLFCLGHVTLDLAVHGATSPLRVATFFPGLWFAWLRARTGGVLAPALAHAVANALAFGLHDAFAP